MVPASSSSVAITPPSASSLSPTLDETPVSPFEWVEKLRSWHIQTIKDYPNYASLTGQPLSNELKEKLERLPLLKENAKGPFVVDLIEILAARGFIEPPMPPISSLYDKSVVTAVKNAEDFYGLPQDGMAGPLLYLNLKTESTVKEKALSDLALVVEKDLKNAQSQGRDFAIIVNIPSFTLHVIDLKTGKTRLESRVIVGLPTRKTPRFQTNIINLKYNPDWNPPPSLVAKGRVFVPPGPQNPLGLLRFSTDNNLNIYLHDTDEHELFERTQRARSSGCIRVQEWKDLASILSSTSEDKVQMEVDKKTTHFIKVPKTPVFVIYSLIDETTNQDGLSQVGVYPDVYDLQGKEEIIGGDILN